MACAISPPMMPAPTTATLKTNMTLCLQFAVQDGRPRQRTGRGGRRRRGDVRVAILRLLSEEPRNGYQVMQEIEERSAGRWRPSPGSVYPALSQLEDEGLIRATEREGVKVFELTDAGQEQVA